MAMLSYQAVILTNATAMHIHSSYLKVQLLVSHSAGSNENVICSTGFLANILREQYILEYHPCTRYRNPVTTVSVVSASLSISIASGALMVGLQEDSLVPSVGPQK